VTTSTRSRTVEYLGCDRPFLFNGRERDINSAGELIIFDDDLDKCLATDIADFGDTAKLLGAEHHGIEVRAFGDVRDELPPVREAGLERGQGRSTP
jgi:hypothetical protein